MIGRLLRDYKGNWLLPPRWCEVEQIDDEHVAVYEVGSDVASIPGIPTVWVEIIPDEQVPDYVWVRLAKKRLRE
jgi:hypothetical protein